MYSISMYDLFKKVIYSRFDLPELNEYMDIGFAIFLQKIIKIWLLNNMQNIHVDMDKVSGKTQKNKKEETVWIGLIVLSRLYKKDVGFSIINSI